MFTKALNLFILIMVCFLATAVSSTIVGCDPFPSTQWWIYDIHTTCPNSVLSWLSTASNGLEITAAMDNCADVPENGASDTSVYFSLNPSTYQMYIRGVVYTIPVSTVLQYKFEYSVMWPKSDSNCVVDLLGYDTKNGTHKINMIDQNGLSNSPSQDLQGAATNKWYSRSFIINGTSLEGISYLNFGFACAANVSNPNQRVQKAYVDDVKLFTIDDDGYLSNQRTLYSSKVNCTGCYGAVAPSIDHVYCDESENTWTVNGSVNQSYIELNTGSVLINGDIYTNTIVLSQYLNLTGCIYPLTSDRLVKFALGDDVAPHSMLSIYMDQDCTIDQWDNSLVPITLVQPGLAIIGQGVVCAASYIGTDGCDPVDPPYYYYGDGALIALVVIVPTMVLTGVIVGIVFGVKKYRERQRARKLEEKMNNATLG